MTIFRKKVMNLVAVAFSTALVAGVQGHSAAQTYNELYTPQQVVNGQQQPVQQQYAQPYRSNDEQYQLPSTYNNQYYGGQDGSGYYGTQRTTDASSANPSIYYYYYY